MIQRWVVLANVLIGVEDHNISRRYFVARRSVRKWADTNLISVRLNERPSVPVEQLEAETLIQSFLGNPSDASKKIRNVLMTQFGILSNEQLVASLQLARIGSVYTHIDRSQSTGELTQYFFYYVAVNSVTISNSSGGALPNTWQSEIEHLIGVPGITFVSFDQLVMLSAREDYYYGKRYSNPIATFTREKLFASSDIIYHEIPGMNQEEWVFLLFGDMRDFGNVMNDIIARTMPATKGQALFLRSFQSSISQEIMGHGGYIVQTSGDGFFAAFDTRPGLDDSIGRKNLMETCADLMRIQNVSYGTSEPESVSLRLGGNFGPARRGFVGPLELREESIFGSHVNIAARLEKGMEELLTQAEKVGTGVLNIPRQTSLLLFSLNEVIRNFLRDRQRHNVGLFEDLLNPDESLHSGAIVLPIDALESFKAALARQSAKDADALQNFLDENNKAFPESEFAIKFLIARTKESTRFFGPWQFCLLVWHKRQPGPDIVQTN